MTVLVASMNASSHESPCDVAQRERDTVDVAKSDAVGMTSAAASDIGASDSATGARSKQQRLCVGCGKHDDADNMMRVVLGPDGQVAVDIARRAQGRGAHLHARHACLKAAISGGFSRSFRTRVRCEMTGLLDQIARVAARRMAGLLYSAQVSGCLVVGRQAVESALSLGRVDLVLVPCDQDGDHDGVQAAARGGGNALRAAIGAGKAVCWGTKSELGAALGRGDVAVVGICSPSFAQAIGGLCRMLDAVAIDVVGTSSEVR